MAYTDGNITRNTNDRANNAEILGKIAIAVSPTTPDVSDELNDDEMVDWELRRKFSVTAFKIGTCAVIKKSPYFLMVNSMRRSRKL